MARNNQRPIGYRYAEAYAAKGENGVRELARVAGEQLNMDAFLNVQSEDPVPAFLHSALCAMSLPTRRPKDEKSPIIRTDGKYTLAISPRPTLIMRDGNPVMEVLGVPFGAYPRVVLIYLLSEAVRAKSRDVYLGESFAAWMRRLGYRSASHGKRGTASLLAAQVERLLACQWVVRWDSINPQGEDSSFAFKEVQISNEHAGAITRDGSFTREIRLSEGFYAHLVDHAVPLNETAISQMLRAPTALDLYTYLAYRLPRVRPNAPQEISWEQLSRHLGNETSRRKFRQIIRGSFELVSSCYPQADVDFDDERVIRLRHSPPPIERKLVGAHLALVGADRRKKPKTVPFSAQPIGEPQLPIEELRNFPESIRWGDDCKTFRQVAEAKSDGADLDMLVGEFRRWSGAQGAKSVAEWVRIFEAFCIKYAARRAAAKG